MSSKAVLGFDYGLRRIGVAVGTPWLGTTTALKPLVARDGDTDWDAVRRLLDEWQPGLLVVGLPLNMDGTPSEMSARAERFARRLHGRFGIPFAVMDERLSTREARSLLEESGRDAEVSIHSAAACLILQSWFATQPRRTENESGA